MCCHPALTPASAIALTLRAVGGLTTAEIATRVPRARGDDGAADQPRQADASRQSGAPFGMPTGGELAERLRSVLHVLYLIFNEGYAASSGTQARAQRAVGRGDPAGADRARVAARTTPRSPACWR